METPEAGDGAAVPQKKITLVSSPVRAIIRMRKKIRSLRNGCLPLDLPSRRSTDSPKSGMRRQVSMESSVFKTSIYEKPNIFKFDSPTLAKATLSPQLRKSKRKKSRPVLYPDNHRKYLPVEQKSKAMRCLILFILIVGFQILNAIENLDDNVQKYDLDGLEKTLKREVFGQRFAIVKIVDIFNDYLATHYHNKPLVISMNGPSGVGKSHMGRILAKHFRSIMDDDFILQYYVRYKCPEDSIVTLCQEDLSEMISSMISRAEMEEKIPFFIFDEVEAMPPPLMDVLKGFFQLNQTNEYLNAVYVLISNLGGNEIIEFILENSTNRARSMDNDLRQVVRSALVEHHSIWNVAEIVPFVLLEKKHILQCFLDELLQEGFYPDQENIQNLAGELNYYTINETKYSTMGCKLVVGRVNLLHPVHSHMDSSGPRGS
uniref:Torsin family 4 member A n=1 Tax=Leptobrachium leishanense TaxID=445787 RepID=A0A8C5R833_9ANUR